MHEIAIENENETCEIIHHHQQQYSINIENNSIKIIDIINANNRKQKYFYSIEVSPLKQLHLNYNEFVELPAFTAVTWLSDTNINCPLNAVPPSIAMVKQIIQSTPVMLHLSCYKLSELKLDEILKCNLKNILALKGGKYNFVIFAYSTAHTTILLFKLL